MERPWWKFYGRAWLGDLELHRCSISARGLWIAMLSLMNEGIPYGHLADKRGRIDEKSLAGMERISVSQCKVLITELEENSVFSRTSEGIIYSRRMVKDEAVRLSRAEGGKRSIENPNVPRPKSIDKGYPCTDTIDHPLLNNEGHPQPLRVRESRALTSDSVLFLDSDGPVDYAKPEKASKNTRKLWFDNEFWPIVWAKIGVGAARNSWCSKIETVEMKDKAVAAAKRQGPRILERGHRPGASVLHPATWLNQERYLDEDEQVTDIDTQYPVWRDPYENKGNV